MKLAHLKGVRVFISLLFLFLTTILFLDIYELISTDTYSYILFFQFIPSLLDFISVPALAATGFLIVILLTLLFGRVYCSSVCPLGISMDIISHRKNRLKNSLSFIYDEPLNKVRYSILAITAVLVIGGILFGLIFLDPYSIFGRFINTFIKPILIIINNTLAFTLESLEIYWLTPVEFKGIQTGAMITSVAFLIIVLVLSLSKGRLYCNSICPVGTLLGLLSKVSLFKIKINNALCTDCGACEKVCKTNCLNSDEKYIDYSRCVACFNCIESCNSDAFIFNPSPIVKDEEPVKLIDANRRDFITNSAVFLFGLTGISKAQEKIEVYTENKFPIIRKNPISPPGSKSIELMMESCTACHLCVSACPTQVLQPSFLEYGFLGMMIPRMNNLTGFCNFDCVICSEVCPTGAIKPITFSEKKLIQIGKAKFVRDNCIVFTQKTACGACAEHCPTKSCKMVPVPDSKLKAPEVTEDICVGCGACEYACPTIPYKSIYVVSNLTHLAAKEPEQKPLELEIDMEEDFPF